MARAAPSRIPLGADEGMKTMLCFHEDAVGIARAVTVLLSVTSASPQIKAGLCNQLDAPRGMAIMYLPLHFPDCARSEGYSFASLSSKRWNESNEP